MANLGFLQCGASTKKRRGKMYLEPVLMGLKKCQCSVKTNHNLPLEKGVRLNRSADLGLKVGDNFQIM